MDQTGHQTDAASVAPHTDLISKAAKFENLLTFKKTPHERALMSMKDHISVRANFSGNQGGKSATFAKEYVMRILGIHPQPGRNRLAKKIRFLGPNMPEPGDADNQDSQQYLEFVRMMPPEMILKDITARSKTMTISSPHHGKCHIEFVGYHQDLQDTGGKQRDSAWYDEEPPKSFREETKMRLLQSGGDECFSLTPVSGLSYLYEDVWVPKGLLWRSPTIQKVFGLPEIEHFSDGNPNIACVNIATDDNPTFDIDTINALFSDVDPDEVPMRRYGVFKQITGMIHKAYNRAIHFIDFDKTFGADGPEYDWTHARGIDYHESRIPWSIGWVTSSPEDEWFLWQEMHPVIDGPRAVTSYEIAKSIARRSLDYRYDLDLIDPLAKKKQPNTGFSAMEDLNQHAWTLEKRGDGTGAHWEGWDTKDVKGRNEIKQRFKNAAAVRKPFNNRVMDKGVSKRLPTLWICNTCPRFDKSIRLWSYQEWATAQSRAVNESKEQVQQKHSHDNMVLEALAKDIRLKPWHRAPRRTRSYSMTGRPI